MRKGWCPKREKEGGKESWKKKEEMLVIQKTLLSLTVSKALTRALGKIKRAIRRVANRNNKRNNNDQIRLMFSPRLDAPSLFPPSIPQALLQIIVFARYWHLVFYVFEVLSPVMNKTHHSLRSSEFSFLLSSSCTFSECNVIWD